MMKKGAYSFIAYIDESGDIGINPDKKGASQWFGIAAFIVRSEQDINLVAHKRNILRASGIQSRDIHMKEIKNEDKRRFIAQEVARFDSQCVVVLSNKISLYNRGVFKTKDSYYQYMSRYLLERITKCCSQWHNCQSKGNGKVKIVFATRGGMNYDALKGYLHTLKDSPAVETKIQKQNLPKIDWDMIDIDEVQNIPAEKRVGLQFADVLSYSFFKAANKNEFGMVNTEYCKFFISRMRHIDGRIWHNGVTIVNTTEIKDQFPAELNKLFNIKTKKKKDRNLLKNTEKLCNIAKIENWKV